MSKLAALLAAVFCMRVLAQVLQFVACGAIALGVGVMWGVGAGVAVGGVLLLVLAVALERMSEPS